MLRLITWPTHFFLIWLMIFIRVRTSPFLLNTFSFPSHHLFTFRHHFPSFDIHHPYQVSKASILLWSVFAMVHTSDP
jgi:hypothetical protein